MNKLLVFWVAVLLLFAGLFTTWYVMQRAKQQPATGQEETDYGPPLESFVLTQSTGDQFNSQSLAGDIWVCNFFYASCPSICLRENFAVQELAEQFAHRGVRFVSITIDPTNDTPSRLADYSKKFNADPKQWFSSRAKWNTFSASATTFSKRRLNRAGILKGCSSSIAPAQSAGPTTSKMPAKCKTCGPS